MRRPYRRRAVPGGRGRDRRSWLALGPRPARARQPSCTITPSSRAASRAASPSRRSCRRGRPWSWPRRGRPACHAVAAVGLGLAEQLRAAARAVATFLGAFAVVWAGFGLAAFVGEMALHHLVDTMPGRRPATADRGRGPGRRRRLRADAGQATVDGRLPRARSIAGSGGSGNNGSSAARPRPRRWTAWRARGR